MSKFEIEYRPLETKKEVVEARHIYEAIDKFSERHKCVERVCVKYIYEGNEKPKEFYCNWWNGNTWKDKVVLAHNEEEVEYNIKDTLDYAVYDFRCCLNTREAISSLMRAKYD